jgi:hypothetical protein
MASALIKTVSGSSLPESLLLLPELCDPDPGTLRSDQHDPNGTIVWEDE